MKSSKTVFKFSFLLLAVNTGLFSCAPVFSEMQTAEKLDEGDHQLMGFYTYNGGIADSGDEFEQTHLGIAYNAYLSRSSDIRFKVDVLSWENHFSMIHIKGGPKFNLIEDRLALQPILGGMIAGDYGLGGGFGITELQLSLLYTHPLTRDLRWTIAPKGIWYLSEFYLFAANTNLQYKLNDHISIMTEFGIAFHSPQEGSINQLGLGLNFDF